MQFFNQWHNRRGGGGAEQSVPPRTFFTGKFLLTYWEKTGMEAKGKWRGKTEFCLGSTKMDNIYWENHIS